jgi:glucose-1-phosphate adenylyltransferase
MGIYVFNRQILIDALDNSFDDFGKHIIPASLNKYKVFAYIFGNTGRTLEPCGPSLKRTSPSPETVPPYNFFDHLNPIYTHARFLPASKIIRAQINKTVIGEGCIITHANIDRAVIGIRSVIENGTTIRNAFLMGAVLPG